MNPEISMENILCHRNLSGKRYSEAEQQIHSPLAQRRDIIRSLSGDMELCAKVVIIRYRQVCLPLNNQKTLEESKQNTQNLIIKKKKTQRPPVQNSLETVFKGKIPFLEMGKSGS